MGTTLGRIRESLLAALCLVSICDSAQSLPATDGCDYEELGSNEMLPRLEVQRGHSDRISAVAFDRSGRTYITASWDGTVRLWHADSGRLIRQFLGHTAPVNAVAFSVNDCYVASGSGVFDHPDATVRVWSISTGRELRRFTHDATVTSVRFARDGRSLLSGSEDGTARLWSLETGEELWSYSMYDGIVLGSGGIRDVAFSEDGELALTNGDDLRLWSTATLPWVLLRQSPRRLGAVVFEPDGRILYEDSSDGKDPRLAISRRGDLLARSSSTSIQVTSTATGDTLRSFVLDPGPFPSFPPPIDFSPSGQRLLTTDGWSRAISYDLDTGDAITLLDAPSSLISAAGFSRDRSLVALGDNGGRVTVWSLEHGQRVEEMRHASPVQSIAMGSDILVTGGGGAATIWSMTAGAALWTIDVPTATRVIVALSPDETRVLAASSNQVQVWSIPSRTLQTQFGTQYLEAAMFPTDDSILITSGFKAEVRSAADGARQVVFAKSDEDVYSKFAFASYVEDGKLCSAPPLQELGGDVTCHEINVPAEILEDVPDGFIGSSSDGFSVLDRDGSWHPLAIPRPEGHDGPILAVDVSPDGSRLLTGAEDGDAILWETESGKFLRRLPSHGDYVAAVAFSPVGDRILTGSGQLVRTWSGAKAVEVQQEFSVAAGRVIGVSYSGDGKLVRAVTSDGSVWFWDTRNGELVARLLLLAENSWASVARDGRFDANDLEGLRSLHWIAPDEPARPLPIEIFMRDYYEPRLLPRVLAGDTFAELPTLTNLNRIQPKVRITHIEGDASALDRVTIILAVESQTDTTDPAAGEVPAESGAYDLRLFRDGQLIASYPRSAIPERLQKSAGSRGRDGIDQWRTVNAIEIDPETKTTEIKFDQVRLWRRPDADTQEFSAYAFNQDRVKSETVRTHYSYPEGVMPRKGRAYLVAVGVNAYENPDWDLTFAVNDANRLRRVIESRLAQTDQFTDIVSVPLLSQRGETRAGVPMSVDNATKPAIDAVLRMLAGRPVDLDLIADVPNAHKLRPARPEDLVILSLSGHGYAAGSGEFYFFSSNIGPGGGRKITEDLLERTISSDELSLWLRDIDAGELVLIVDACHSAATVDTPGFKPGPMGSRGLGQLAYDKGMRVLAASQVDKPALELNTLGHGLLTYALVHDGLIGGQADFKPRDFTVRLGEWLEYGATRVPGLYREIKMGSLSDFGHALHTKGTTPAGDIEAFWRESPLLQRPALFDYGRRPHDVVVARVVSVRDIQ